MLLAILRHPEVTHELFFTLNFDPPKQSYFVRAGDVRVHGGFVGRHSRKLFDQEDWNPVKMTAKYEPHRGPRDSGSDIGALDRRR